MLHVSQPGYAGVQLACTVLTNALIIGDLYRQVPELFRPRFLVSALRDALPKLEGNLLIGAINSIGVRRDTKAVDALAHERRDAPEVAR